jgi:hypothetical protein
MAFQALDELSIDGTIDMDGMVVGGGDDAVV